jgi:uncharacterized iron-regulated protein
MNWKELTVKYIKDLVKPKSIREIIFKEIREAQLRKLEAESGVEYAVSVVQYNEKRIKRLEERLQHHEEDKENT